MKTEDEVLLILVRLLPAKSAPWKINVKTDFVQLLFTKHRDKLSQEQKYSNNNCFISVPYLQTILATGKCWFVKETHIFSDPVSSKVIIQKKIQSLYSTYKLYPKPTIHNGIYHRFNFLPLWKRNIKTPQLLKAAIKLTLKEPPKTKTNNNNLAV